MNARDNINFLKNSARYPKVAVTPLSVPTVQVSNNEWNQMVGAMDNLDKEKVGLSVITGKNLFNKNAARSYVTESQTSSTGYIITDSNGNVEEFVGHSSSDTAETDGLPDENIYGAYYHQYFGWIYDAISFTSHKIPFGSGAVTATFFNGGTAKTILAFDAFGNYLGYVITDSDDWAHITMLASQFSGVAYVRLSNCSVSADPSVLQLESGTEYTEYEEYHAEKTVAKNNLPSDTVYSSSEEWNNVVTGLEQKAPLEVIDGKNHFNKNAARSYVTESQTSSTGYIITDSNGNVEEFVSHSSSDTAETDGLPDENIYGAYYHQYFGWIYDAISFTSHKIPFGSGAVTATFFNGGIAKTILAFDASGNYLGYVVTSSSDWAHITMLASNFTGVAYVRLSSCNISSDPSVMQLEAGTTPTSYEPYISESVVPKSSLPRDTVYESDLIGKAKNQGAATTLKSGMIDIVVGHYDQDGHPVTGSGSQYISDYVPIFGSLVYEFEYINAIHFYDGNKEEVQGTTIESGFAYKAPDNAQYMSVSFNGVSRISYSSVYASDYTAARRASDLNLLPSNAPTVNQIVGSHLHKSTYIIGDSEASNFHHYVEAVGMSRIVSSFGGHTTDLIATNVGQGTGGIGSLTHLRGANVIVVAGTNDQSGEQDARLIAYHRELIKNLRAAGANEIYAISPFWDISRTVASREANTFLPKLKRLYGGRYIDVLGHILDSGIYYNPYHPEAFTQPSVNGSVTMKFEDVDALVECGMVAVGDKFCIAYYDDKVDVYQTTSYSTTNNTVTAKLITNGSDVEPGDTGGVYEESVTTTAWAGTKKTLGWVYSEEDGTRIANGYVPACIYADRSVHFGKLVARVIENMLGLWYDAIS